MCLCTYQGLMCCLCRFLQLCSDKTQDRVFSPVVVFPDLVQGCGMRWAGLEHFFTWAWDPSVVAVGMEAAGLLSEVGAASMALFEKAPTMAAAITTGPLPGPVSLLCVFQMESFPRTLLSQIECQAVAWSEWVQRVPSAQTEGSREGAVPRADLSPPSLVASQHLHTPPEQSLGSSSLSTCPSSSPSSQGGLSPPWSIPGLRCPLYGSIHSLPRANACPCDLPFPLSPLPRAQVSTQCDAFLPPDYMGIFPAALVIQDQFCQFPVSFPLVLFHMYIFFWCVGEGELHVLFSAIFIPPLCNNLF